MVEPSHRAAIAAPPRHWPARTTAAPRTARRRARIASPPSARRRSTSPSRWSRQRARAGRPRFARRALLDDPLVPRCPTATRSPARRWRSKRSGETWVGPSPAPRAWRSRSRARSRLHAAPGASHQRLHDADDLRGRRLASLVPRLAQGRIPDGVTLVALRDAARAARPRDPPRRQGAPDVAAVLDASAAAAVAAPRPAVAARSAPTSSVCRVS
jgi:hypothetical protein